MNSLPKYMKGEKGRFDFRVPDGLGHWVFPDWDDPDLKVEFYDADNNLKTTANVGGDPALVQGDDYHEENNPDGGKFVAIDNIDLTGFVLGVAEARVYAKVSDVEVMPYPTIIAAFEVVADAAEGPLYTTVDRVKQEVPGKWPDTVTDDMVMLAVADASRKIDAFLITCYDTPFPGVNDDPATPALIETICRKLAAHQCLLWMGRANVAGQDSLKQLALSELERLVPSQGKTPLVRLAGYTGPVAAYRGDVSRTDDQSQEDVLT